MRAERAGLNRAEHRAFSLLNWVCSIIAAAVIVALVFTLWFTGIRISDSGMSPTLYPGDVVLFDRLSMHISMPKRGETYAFRTEGGTSVGRIIGLPGDRVEIREGNVYISGCLLDEDAYRPEGSWDMDGVTLGQGEFFIMPDDRQSGACDPAAMRVTQDRLIGRAALRVSPFLTACFFRA